MISHHICVKDGLAIIDILTRRNQNRYFTRRNMKIKMQHLKSLFRKEKKKRGVCRRYTPRDSYIMDIDPGSLFPKFKTFIKDLKATTVLKDLRIESLPLTNSQIKKLIKALEENISITKFSFQNITTKNNKWVTYFPLLLNVNTNIVELNLSENFFTNENIECFLGGIEANTTLTSLYLESVAFATEGGRIVTKFLESNTTLKCLYLENNLVTNFRLTTLNLKVLDLSSNLLVNIDDMNEALKTNTTLKSLYLGYNNLKTIGNFLEYNTTLKGLHLESNEIDVFPDCLRFNSMLKTLNLARNHIKVLSECPYLENLNLLNNGMIDIKSFPSNTSLTNLNLSYNKIEEAEMSCLEKLPLKFLLVDTFFESLKYNTTITHLYLGKGDDSKENLSHYLEILESNTTLQDLNLSRNTFEINEVISIFEKLKTNTILKSINLGSIDDFFHDKSVVKCLEEVFNVNPNLVYIHQGHFHDYVSVLVEQNVANTQRRFITLVDIILNSKLV